VLVKFFMPRAAQRRMKRQCLDSLIGPVQEHKAGEHWRPEPVVKFGLDTAGNSDWLPPHLRMSTRGRISFFSVLSCWQGGHLWT
jgi:hypothetical protein